MVLDDVSCQMARDDLEFFSSRVLGFENAGFQRDWYWRLQPMNSPEHFSPFVEHPGALKRFLRLAPKKHSKSQCVSVNWLAWLIGNRPDIHVLLATKTANLAEKIGIALTATLESSPYIDVFGELKPRNPQKWTSTEFIVQRRRIDKSPTFYATGLMGTITGTGNDLIVCDDLIDEDDVITDNAREKASTWFHKVLYNSRYPWGGVYVVGTRWHYDDLYGELISEGWPYEVQKAIIDDEADCLAKGVKPRVLWPEYWSYDKLCEVREAVGTIFFDCLYQNDPTSMQGRMLKADMLQSYERLPDGLVMYAGMDPALGEGDNQAVATLGYDPALRQGYLIDLWEDRLSPVEFFKKVQQLNSVHHYAKIFVESNAFQKVLMNEPDLEGLPTVGSPTIQNDDMRYIAMSSHFESKRILVNPVLNNPRSRFWLEWVQYPRGSHDDGLAATEIAVRNVLGNRGKPFVGKIPW